jgi:hypothetical protein
MATAPAALLVRAARVLDAAPAMATAPAADDVTASRVTAAAPVMPEAGADGTQMGRVK